jgi:hypothetical protein
MARGVNPPSAGAASTLDKDLAEKSADNFAAGSDKEEETEVARLLRFHPRCIHCGAERSGDLSHCTFCGAAF